MKDPTSPETTSLAYDTMLPAWQKMQSVLDGTKAMRAAGTTLLPKHFGESDESYKERLERSTLKNITKLTLNSWVGRPFSKPIAFEDLPPQIEDLSTDVDLQGNDVQVFSRNWFKEGLAKGYCHCYVDFPRTDNEGVRTLADDRAEGVRPYWVLLRPEQVFFAEAETIAGQEILREIRIMEEVNDREGFAESVQPQIRRVFIDETGAVQVEIYRLKEPKKARDRREWLIFDSYSHSLPVIPLVTFYTDRDDFMLSTPPLEDLADLNIAHWQSTSDQRAILTVARFPILAISGGAASEKEIIIGPKRMLHSPDPAAKFYYVEHSGHAIASGQTDLESLESSMAEYGAEFLKKRPGSSTATARALDTAEATSPLQDVALRFSHALDQALEYTALWLKMDPAQAGFSHVNTKFTDAGGDQVTLNALRETRKMKDISREAYLTELQNRSVLSDSYDIQEDAVLLENEALSMNPVSFELAPDPDDPGEGSGAGRSEPGR